MLVLTVYRAPSFSSLLFGRYYTECACREQGGIQRGGSAGWLWRPCADSPAEIDSRAQARTRPPEVLLALAPAHLRAHLQAAVRAGSGAGSRRYTYSTPYVLRGRSLYIVCRARHAHMGMKMPCLHEMWRVCGQRNPCNPLLHTALPCATQSMYDTTCIHVPAYKFASLDFAEWFGRPPCLW